MVHQIWPRGYVGAASFWNYIPNTDPINPNFRDTWLAFNDVMIARGVLACPSDCACDELYQCGNPYLPTAL